VTTDEQKEIKAGDVVMLKSDSLRMTVNAVAGDAPSTVLTVWFDSERKQQRGKFYMQELRKVQ
jgi:uncharacterized protein YodC (DUF2158 family)